MCSIKKSTLSEYYPLKEKKKQPGIDIDIATLLKVETGA